MTNMLALVTGVAGFIGSHLSERLLSEGYGVIGIDSFSNYYPKERKLANLAIMRNNEDFTFVEGDLSELDLDKLVNHVDRVFHLAAQPGVRGSWGLAFSDYVRDNIVATQRLLEAVKDRDTLRSFVYASSSSVYGEAESLPTAEDTLPMPISPYGVTKLAAENLCQTYFKSFGVPIVALRYFTVYGPRQRPDMAFSQLINRIYTGSEFEVYGDGEQSRDFTFCDDTVSACLLARNATAGGIYNVGTGKPVKLNDVIAMIENLTGKHAKVVHSVGLAGDVRSTCADISKLQRDVGYHPMVSLHEGLKKQVEWQLLADQDLKAFNGNVELSAA